MCVPIPGRSRRGLGQDPEHHCIDGMFPGDGGTKGEVGGLAQGHRRNLFLSWIGTQVPLCRWHADATQPSTSPCLSLSSSLAIAAGVHCFQGKEMDSI